MTTKCLNSLPLPGMEAADAEREEAAQIAIAEELTTVLRKPLGNIDSATGEMERDSPLFFGTGTNPTLF